MDNPKQLVQRKIRQLVFLHANHVHSVYGKIAVDQNLEYQRIYADYQAGIYTLDEIQDDVNEYLQMKMDLQ